LLDGLYRPCGRPFINHLAGTASVLLFYGCPMPHVIAALLHAVYTHGPPAKVPNWLNYLAQTYHEGRTAVRMIERYGERADLLDSADFSGGGMAELPLDTASLFLIDAANEIDMFLSLEVCVTGRSDVLPEARRDNCIALLDNIGLPGMAATLRGVRDQVEGLAPVPLQTKTQISFRIPAGLSGSAPPQR